MPDSISNTQQAADSAQVYYAPQYTDGFPQPEAGDSTAQQSLQSLPVMEIPQGTAPTSPLTSPLHDTGTMTMVLAAVFIVVASYRTGYKYFEQFLHNMFSVRRRENVFEDRNINETWTLTALTLSTCVMEGVMAFHAIDYLVPSLGTSLHGSVFAHVAMFTGLALVFFLMQLLVYTVVGHTFADGIATKLWTDGFKAAHSLLGIALVPIVGVLLVLPSSCKIMLILAAILYILCRIPFICKGFRIFYHGIQSLVYFILYLCAVEIVPLVMISAGTVYLCTVLTH